MTLRARPLAAAALGLLLVSACGGEEKPPPPPREYVAADHLQPLDAEEVRAIVESGEGPVVIDVRPPPAYARGHIPGTPNYFSKRIQDRFPELRQYAERGIVVVCENGLNSRRAGLKLLNEGFPKVFLLRGHLREWKERGYPIEASPEE